MGSFRTSLGQEFELERRLPPIGWKPRFRGLDAGPGVGDLDFGGDDLGIFAIFGLIIAAVVLLLIAIPLLIFVAELALLLALVIPLMVLALTVGLKQHLVVLRDTSTGQVVDQRSVHGVIGTVRAGRALRAAAHAGAYRR